MGIKFTKHFSKDDVETQTDIEKHHFDFSPLKAAYHDFIEDYHARDMNQKKTAWNENVGGAQKNLPAHVAMEYCRNDRSFYPAPEFKETTLPFDIDGRWFANDGLGVNSAFIRANRDSANTYLLRDWELPHVAAGYDLSAITELERVRTEEFVMLKDKLLHKSTPNISPSC